MDLRAASPRADRGHDLAGHRMVRCVPIPAERSEGRLGAFDRAPDGDAPGSVVAVREAGEQADERRFRALADPVRQIVAEHLGAAALEDPRRPQQSGNDAVAPLLRLGEAALHAGARLPASVGVWNSPVIQDPLRGERRHDALTQVVGVASGDVDVEGRIGGPGRPRLPVEFPGRDLPPIAQPERDGAAIRCRRLAGAVEEERARFLRGTVPQLPLRRRASRLHCGAKELVPFCADRRFVTSDGRRVPLVIAVPLGALGRLDAVLDAYLHQHPFFRKRAERVRNLLPERAGIAGQVPDEQVGKRRGVRAHAGVHGRLARQFPDQEDEARQIAPPPSLGRPVVEALDAGVDLVQEHPGVHEV